MLKITYFPIWGTDGRVDRGVAMFKGIQSQNQLPKVPDFGYEQFQDVLETMSDATERKQQHQALG